MTTVTLGSEDKWTGSMKHWWGFWAIAGYRSNREKCLGLQKIYISQINKQLNEFIMQIGYANETSRNLALPSKYILPMSRLLLKEILWRHCYRRLEKAPARDSGRRIRNKKNTVFLVGDGHKRNRWHFLWDWGRKFF